MNDRLYLRNKVFWCSYYRPDGKRVQVSTKCTDRKAAAFVLRRFEMQAQGAGSLNKGYLALSDVLDDLEAWIKANRSDASLIIVKQKSNNLRRILGENTDVHTMTMADWPALHLGA